ncbi:MAG: Gfo/Idh/MocA family protein [Desulfobaccales bacterium]
MKKIKIGLIGCGKQAPKHISGLRKVPGVELVISDINPQLAQQMAEKEKVQWTPKVEEIFGDSEILGVDICTPTNTHIELIRWALKAGKDFFCEKPLCENVAEARAIQELLAGTGRIGMVGYIYRFAPAFELGHKLFEDVPLSGESMVLGPVILAYFRLGGRGGHQLWKHQKETSGGAINEMLVHMVDLALWFFGPVKSAQLVATELLRPKRPIQGQEFAVDAEDFAVVRLQMASGVEVWCQADLITPAFTQFIEVQGEYGTFMASIQKEMPSFIFCTHDALGYPAGRTTINFGYQNLFEAQMAEFARAVRFRIQPRHCTIEDSVLLLEALEKITQGKS